MDWRELATRRWQLGAVVAAILVVGWYLLAFAPRRQESQALQAQTDALAAEKLELERAIADAKAKAAPATVVARLAPPEAGKLAAVDRLKFFLESITEPANDLDLAYFTVTPLAPHSTPAYEEVPFSIAVSGSYASLADFLYQLEYERDFVVRDVNLTRNEPNGVRANFQLAALLPRDPSTQAAPPPAEDPGRPTSLELARDPFTRAPAVLVKGTDGRLTFLNVPPGLTLSGILASGPRLAAIINHEPYGVGDVIDNKRITRITRAGVEMTDDARTYFLEMAQPAVQRQAQGKEQTKEASRR